VTGIHVGSPDPSDLGPARSSLTAGAVSASAVGVLDASWVAPCSGSAVVVTGGVDWLGEGEADPLGAGVPVGPVLADFRCGLTCLVAPGFLATAGADWPAPGWLASAEPLIGGLTRGFTRLPPCQTQATLPPLGTRRPSTPMLEKIQLPSRPFDQYSPQKASAGGAITQPGLGAGRELTKQTNPGNLLVSTIDTPADRNSDLAGMEPLLETQSVSIPRPLPPGTPV